MTTITYAQLIEAFRSDEKLIGWAMVSRQDAIDAGVTTWTPEMGEALGVGMREWALSWIRDIAEAQR